MIATKLACPYCGSTRFSRTTYDTVEMTDDEEGITDELIDGWCVEYEYSCAECEKQVNVSELVRHSPKTKTQEAEGGHPSALQQEAV